MMSKRNVGIWSTDEHAPPFHLSHLSEGNANRRDRLPFSEAVRSFDKNKSLIVMPRRTTILAKPKDDAAEDGLGSNENISQLQTTPQKTTIVVTNRQGPFVRPKTVLSSALSETSNRTNMHTRARTVEHPAISEVQEKSDLPVMQASLRLLSDNMELTDVVADYLSETNTNFTVIGIIGPQGTGKSTLMSMLAGNNHQDMYRQYAFRPASREAVELCHHQTSKISIFVTKNRLILLDCQAICSSTILMDLSHGRRNGPSKPTDMSYGACSAEIESLKLTSFLLQVCHTVLLCVDWFIDIDIVRHVRTSEMLRITPSHYAPDSIKYKPSREINLILVHQRAKSDDFHPGTLRYRSAILERLFADSKLNVNRGMSLAGLGHRLYKDLAPKTNYVLLTEMKPRQKPDISVTPAHSNDLCLQSTIIEYDVVLRSFRNRILGLPRESFVIGEKEITEIQWYEFVTRTWCTIMGKSDFDNYAGVLADLGND